MNGDEHDGDPMAALKALRITGKIPLPVAVGRVGALLLTVCRLTSDPAASLQFAIELMQERLAEMRANRKGPS